MKVSKSSFSDTSLYAFFSTLNDLVNYGSRGLDSVGSAVSSLVKSLDSLGGGSAATITSSSSLLSSYYFSSYGAFCSSFSCCSVAWARVPLAL